MKRLTLLLLMILTASVVFSQAWNKQSYVQKDTKGKKNFFEMQKDFNEYWKPYDLQGGYYFENGVKKKAAGWKQFKRWEWYWETRVDGKTGEFPAINLLKKQQAFAKTKASKSSKADQSNWENMGPDSSDHGYAGIGRINCITFHPTDTNTFWIGAPAGGLWKTTDCGDTWEVLTDSLPVLGVSEIILANDYISSKIIYIATGDRDAGDNYSIGVLKSTDDGLNWATTALSFNVSQRVRITRLLVHPTNSDLMYASINGGGIYKTDNGWTSYSEIASGYIYDMEFQPNCEDTVIYAAKRVSGGNEIIKTSDAGINWEVMYTFSSSVGRFELDVAESDSTIIYALACNSSSSSGFEGIYKSDKSGFEFTKIYDGATEKNLLGWAYDGSDDGGQGWYDLTLSVSPVNENIVFVGGVNSWKSMDGGVTWNINNHWWGDRVPAVHADKHYMEFQDSNSFFEANDGGIYKTTDGGVTWEDLSDGLVISQIYKFGVSQTAVDEVIAGLQDNGSKLLSSSTWIDVTGGDGMECLIDYEDEQIQYSTLYYGDIYKTTDHWSSYSSISANIPGGSAGAWVTPFLIDPDDNQTLYVGYGPVWKTTDRGNTWTRIFGFDLPNKIRAMAICESDNKTIFITDHDQFYRTTDGGDNWNNLTNYLPSTSNSLTSISIDANNPQHLWITFGGYDAIKAFESTDGGSSWTDISAGLPEVSANTIIQNKLSSTQQLYAGTDFGVFFKDGDSDWTLFGKNLPSVVVTELEIFYDKTTPANSVLYASTYGRGLWKSNLSTFDLAVIQVNSINDIYYVSNDSSAIISIPFEINETFSSNTFTAYLSDETGDFSSEVAIGELVSDVAGTFVGTIPRGTISGTGYKVKIKASSPVHESAAGNSFEIVLDNVAPTVVISSNETTNTSSDPINVTITFSEDVNEFIETDITIGNGTVLSFDETNSPVYSVSITPTTSGSVTVDVPVGVALDIVGNENTVTTQWSINYTATGIDKLIEFGIKIFPNPSNGIFTIEVERNNSITDISIIDLSGRIIYNDVFSSDNSKEIDLSGFAKGVYILQLKVENEKLISKILIE